MAMNERESGISYIIAIGLFLTAMFLCSWIQKKREQRQLAAVSPTVLEADEEPSDEEKRCTFIKCLDVLKVIEIWPILPDPDGNDDMLLPFTLRVHGYEILHSSFILKLAGSQRFMRLSKLFTADSGKTVSIDGGDESYLEPSKRITINEVDENDNVRDVWNTCHSNSDNCCAAIYLNKSNNGNDNVEKNVNKCLTTPENTVSIDLNSLLLGCDEGTVTNTNSMHTFLLSQNHFFRMDNCSICLLEFNDGDVVCWSKNPDCSHAFHRDCIFCWLMRSNLCPCCRNDYVYEAKERPPTQSHSPDSIMAITTSSLDFDETSTSIEEEQNENTEHDV